jgi:hypothetical protein
MIGRGYVGEIGHAVCEGDRQAKCHPVLNTGSFLLKSRRSGDGNIFNNCGDFPIY